MSEERDWLFDEDEILKTVRRFEDMMRENSNYFFDVHELEGLINYFIDSNNFSKASSATEYAYKLYPDSTIIQMKIAQLLIDRGKLKESMQILNKLEKIEGSNYELYILKGTALNILGNLNEALQQFDKAVELTADNRNEVLYNIGLSFQQQQQFELAIRYFKQALDIDNTNFTVLYDLAYCYDRLNILEMSIEYYEKYLDEDPYSDNAWFNLGTVYNKAGNYAKAIEAYDFSITINENYGSAYFNKGNVLSNLNRYSEALEAYLDFIKIEEDHTMTLCYIGECYEKLKQMEDSFFYFQKALSIDPECADAWFGCGIVKMHDELYDESLTFIQRAIDLDASNAEYLYALGLVYMRKNDYSNSLAAYKRAVEIDPTDYDSWLNYSEIYYLENKLDKAIDVLNKAYVKNFENCYINMRLAVYHLLKSNREQGCGYLEKALLLNPESIEELILYYPEAMNDLTIKEIIDDYSQQNPN